MTLKYESQPTTPESLFFTRRSILFFLICFCLLFQQNIIFIIVADQSLSIAYYLFHLHSEVGEDYCFQTHTHTQVGKGAYPPRGGLVNNRYSKHVLNFDIVKKSCSNYYRAEQGFELWPWINKRFLTYTRLQYDASNEKVEGRHCCAGWAITAVRGIYRESERTHLLIIYRIDLCRANFPPEKPQSNSTSEFCGYVSAADWSRRKTPLSGDKSKHWMYNLQGSPSVVSRYQVVGAQAVYINVSPRVVSSNHFSSATKIDSKSKEYCESRDLESRGTAIAAWKYQVGRYSHEGLVAVIYICDICYHGIWRLSRWRSPPNGLETWNLHARTKKRAC